MRLTKGLKAPVPLVCDHGHKFYAEAETHRLCPFCLYTEVMALRSRIAQARNTLDLVQNVLSS